MILNMEKLRVSLWTSINLSFFGVMGGGMISHFTIAVLTKVYLWLGSYELP